MNNVIRPNCWQRNAAYLRNGDLPPVGRPTSVVVILALAVIGWAVLAKIIAWVLMTVMP